MTPPSPRPRRSVALLAIGAAAGIALAASGLFSRSPRGGAPLPPDAIARVNETTITRDEYRRTVEALAADKRNPLTDDDRRYALDRLIDEELLVQRGLEVGVAASDPAVRKAIASAMITQITAEAAAEEPDEAELERFFADHRDFFVGVDRLRLRQLTIAVRPDRDDASARRLAQRAYEALEAGTPFDQVRHQYADAGGLEPPDTLLPPSKLADYLGPTLVRTALELQPGQNCPPVQVGSSYRILHLVERQPGATPDLATIRSQVATEYRRRRSSQAFTDYLDGLRKRAALQVAPELPR